MSVTRKSLAAIAAALLGFGACSDEKADAPGAPTAVVTPAPAASPTSPPPATKTCALPDQPDCGSSCCSRGGDLQFEKEIEAAQAELRSSKPELFNPNGSLRVDEDEYTAELAKKITEMFGLCARGGGIGSVSHDEVSVKRNNDLSQNVDVIAGFNNSPHVGGVYTCTPASF
jgi:hypothetical protein